MNDAQTWTLIGGFLAILVAMSALVLGIVRAEITAVRERVDGLSGRFDAKFDGLRNEMIARFDTVDIRFDTANSTFKIRFDTIDERLGKIEKFDERIARLETS
jgi:hypothetical protein